MSLCEVRTIGGIMIVAMPPQIDHVVALTLERELRDLAESRPEALFCDFSASKYISSSGLRVILATAKIVKGAGGRFGIFSLAPFVVHIISVSGFTPLIAIYENEDAALRAVSG